VIALAMFVLASLDPALIERLTGVAPRPDPSEPGVLKVSVPRKDLGVVAAGVRMTPPQGLTSWAAFKEGGGHTMVMGDMVVLEDQVNPVMSVALDNGLEVTALHNHFLWETPRVMFMHIGGRGDAAALAGSVGKVLEAVGRPAAAPPSRAPLDPARTTLQAARLEAILGHKGQLADGVFRVVVGRTTRHHGQPVGAAMGVNTWAAFAGSDADAVVDGDVAMLESELQDVLRALRGSGIEIVAIHNHMTGEEPRMIFLHYWGRGPAEGLARGLRAALDRTRQAAH
jgi:Domain of Unknown Function (DUF1259)